MSDPDKCKKRLGVPLSSRGHSERFNKGSVAPSFPNPLLPTSWEIPNILGEPAF